MIHPSKGALAPCDPVWSDDTLLLLVKPKPLPVVAPFLVGWSSLVMFVDFLNLWVFLVLLGIGTVAFAFWRHREHRPRIPIRIDPERITTPTQIISRSNVKMVSLSWEQPGASQRSEAVARITCLTPFGERSFEALCSPATALGLHRLLQNWHAGLDTNTWGTPAWWGELHGTDWSPSRTAELAALEPRTVADGLQVDLRRRTRRAWYGIVLLALSPVLWTVLLWIGPLTTIPGLSVFGLKVGPLELLVLLAACAPALFGLFLLLVRNAKEPVTITPVGLVIGNERFSFQNMESIALEGGALHVQNQQSRFILEHSDLPALYALAEMLEATRNEKHSKANPVALRSLRALTRM